MNTKALNTHLKIHFLIDHSFNNKTVIDNKVAEITYALQEVIKKFTF